MFWNQFHLILKAHQKFLNSSSVMLDLVLKISQDIVEMFEVGYSQYICGEMKSTELPVYLELHIYTSDKEKQVYVDGWTFNKNGSISFPLIPTLPPGKYWAYISWARPALIELEFDVVKQR